MSSADLFFMINDFKNNKKNVLLILSLLYLGK